MRALIVGTSGQLATELRRGARGGGALELLPAEKLDVSQAAAVRELLERARPGGLLGPIYALCER